MMGWVAGFFALALGEGFYAEMSTGYSPTVAFRLHQQLASSESQNSLVRRYRQGVGWEYLLLSERFESAEAAATYAEHWTELTGRGAGIYADSPAVQAPRSMQTAPIVPSRDSLLARLSRTLGGAGGGHERLSTSQALHFVYEREVLEDDSLFAARHVYTKRDGTTELVTEPMGVQELASRAVLTGEDGWLWTGEGGAQPAAPDAVAQLLEHMGPGGIFAFVLDLPTRLQNSALYNNLEFVETTTREGRICAVLSSVETGGGVQLVVDLVDWWLMEASLLGDMGLVVYRFGDWREIDTNLVVPFKLELVRDTRVLEKIRVLDLLLENPSTQGKTRVYSSVNHLP